MSKSVVSISPSTTIAEALDTMVRSRLSGLPVIDDVGRLVGMVSEGDFLRRSELGAEKPSSSWIASDLIGATWIHATLGLMPTFRSP